MRARMPFGKFKFRLGSLPISYPLAPTTRGVQVFGCSMRLLDPSMATLGTTGRPEALTKKETPILRNCSACRLFSARPVRVTSSAFVKNMSILTDFLLLGRERLSTFSICCLRLGPCSQGPALPRDEFCKIFALSISLSIQLFRDLDCFSRKQILQVRHPPS